MTTANEDLAFRLIDLLGPLPEPGTRTDWHRNGYGKPAYTAEQMRAYAAQEVVADRERLAMAVRKQMPQVEWTEAQVARGQTCRAILDRMKA